MFIYATTYSLARLAPRFTVVLGLRSEGLFYTRLRQVYFLAWKRLYVPLRLSPEGTERNRFTSGAAWKDTQSRDTGVIRPEWRAANLRDTDAPADSR